MLTAQAAANDLGIELIIRHGQGESSYRTKKLGIELLNTEPKLDYFITGYWVGVTDTHIDIARQRGTKVFIFNSDINPNDRNAMGKPRSIHKHWIGHMIPDDATAAETLTVELIRRAQTHAGNGNLKISILCVSGNTDNTVSTDRNRGAQRAADRFDNVEIAAIEYDEWSQSAAFSSTAEAITGIPELSVVVAASDHMAIGVIDAASKSGKSPGKDFFVGGFDVSEEGLEHLQSGKLSASMGGHFLEAAWALILIYDYHHGKDFADELNVQIPTQMHIVTDATYKQFEKIFGDFDWESVDFRKLSKTYNPSLKTYNLGIERLL